MKNRALLPLLFLLLCGVGIYAAATGGSSDDPLVSLSYLNGTYTDTVRQKVDALLSGGETPVSSASSAAGWTEARLKSGDALSGSTGTNMMVSAGNVVVSFSSGAVVDATVGAEIASGSTLDARHRYIVAEDTSAVFSVFGKTAVVNYQGPYAVTASDATDYNAMAQALKSLHLFRGSLTGYGSGFDLEVSPTRLQALIMFIRLLGEEEEALACTETAPFTDIGSGDPARYVAYAYSKGYTNGFTKTTFNPSQKVNAHQYTEFVLRALGYSDTGTVDLSGTLDRAVTCGVLTAGERDMLARDPFLRAELVYISFYALDAQISGTGQTLRQSLIGKGIFTQSESTAASAMISSPRIP